MIRRELNELDSRKFHFHFSAKNILHDAEKYGSKYGVQALKYGTKFAGNTKYGKLLKYAPQAMKVAKLAKMFARDDFDDYDSFVARDVDPIDELEELLARTPGHRLRKALKAVKQVRKQLKKANKYYKQYKQNLKATAAGAGVGAGVAAGVDAGVNAADQPPQDPQAQPTDATATDIASRELDAHLEILERAFSHWAGGIEERDLYGGDAESLFQREYEEFGLDELD